ncbi:thioesterase II family protein [Tardiphaga sp. P5_C10]
MMDRSWFLKRGSAVNSVRLYCFSYAGGNAASYLGWQEQLPAPLEICAVQLPGRSARYAEPPYHDLPTLMDTLVPLLAQSVDRPFAFFGHSLGALVAFEAARGLALRGASLPCHLIVSGCHAPRFRDEPKGRHLLDDSALIDVLRDYNGTPTEILADPDLMTMLLPVIRADFALAETYRYQPSPPLAVPITAFAGTDEDRASIDQITGWSLETSAGFDHHLFAGDHFFIHGQRDQVLQRIACTLGANAIA